MDGFAPLLRQILPVTQRVFRAPPERCGRVFLAGPVAWSSIGDTEALLLMDVSFRLSAPHRCGSSTHTHAKR